MMENKQYARLVRAVFGEKSTTFDAAAVNANEELVAAVDEMTEALFAAGTLEAVAVNDVLPEGKDAAAFAEYIRDNAEEIAKMYLSKALRTLRHPQNSKKIKVYVQDQLTTED